jgi:hypothetical protein
MAIFMYSIFPISLVGVRMNPLGTLATICILNQPWMIHDDECEAASEMTDRGNLSTQRKPALTLLCPTRTPHDLTWAQTGATMVGSQQLTGSAMAWPVCAPSVYHPMKCFSS